MKYRFVSDSYLEGPIKSVTFRYSVRHAKFVYFYVINFYYISMVANLEFFSFYVLNSGKWLFHNVVAYWLAVLFLAGEKTLLKVEKTLIFL